MQLPLTIWHPADFSASDQKRQLAAGLYFGAMSIMVLYNLFMYFGIGDRSFIFYVGFVACISLFVSSLTGYSFQYLWPEAISWNEKSIGFFLSLAVNFAVMFTHRFLGASDETRPWLIRQGLLLIEQVLRPFAQVMPGLRVAAALGLDGAIAALLVGARQTTDQQLMVADAQGQRLPILLVLGEGGDGFLMVVGFRLQVGVAEQCACHPAQGMSAGLVGLTGQFLQRGGHDVVVAGAGQQPGGTADAVIKGAVVVAAEPGAQQLPLGAQPFHGHPAVVHGVGGQGLILQIRQCLLIDVDGLLA
jgi:hypothetical protein